MKKSYLLALLLFSTIACVPNMGTPNTSVSSSPTMSPMTSTSPNINVSASATISTDPSVSASPVVTVSPSDSISVSPMPTVSASVAANGRLVIPANFLDSSSIYSGSVSLKWSGVSGAKFYKIYRDNTLIADNVKDTEYLSAGLSSDTDYTFSITAVNDAGESDKFNYIIKTKKSSSSGGSGGGGSYSGGSSSTSQTGTVGVSGGYPYRN